jgi:uncharacterized protein (DUF2235 family)
VHPEARVPKNIVIFSDGTGQRGGLLFEERRSNIYKLYRAARCGPDSTIDPAEQLAFYDAGIGTVPGGITGIGRVGRRLYNILGQATGLGLTANIVDCYAFLIRHWQPGDRIFLFGFSRGAYTVRCVGGVLALCGVPTRGESGAPLQRDPVSAGRLAKKAVKRVYQHFRARREPKPDPLRAALAARFRAEHGSDDGGKANVSPHFIGVFDTVASLANRTVLIALILAAPALLAALAGAACYVFGLPFWPSFGWLAGIAAAFALAAYLATHVKVAFGLPGYRWWRTLRLTRLWMQFYDENLNPSVAYAKHALAIDERRAAFDRVPWRTPAAMPEKPPAWFEQIWFAGCHSDIGGGYPEDETRLSDIALRWMAGAAQSVPDGLELDASVLKLYPSAAGMQHDETKRGLFKRLCKIAPKMAKVRDIPRNAILHPSVYERCQLPSVLHYDVTEPYRPEALKDHTEFTHRCCGP